MTEDNILIMFFNAIDPIIDIVIDLTLPFFPLNVVIAFIWGGLKETIGEVLF